MSKKNDIESCVNEIKNTINILKSSNNYERKHNLLKTKVNGLISNLIDYSISKNFGDPYPDILLSKETQDFLNDLINQHSSFLYYATEKRIKDAIREVNNDPKWENDRVRINPQSAEAHRKAEEARKAKEAEEIRKKVEEARKQAEEARKKFEEEQKRRFKETQEKMKDFFENIKKNNSVSSDEVSQQRRTRRNNRGY